MINKRDDLRTFIVIIAVCAVCGLIVLVLNIKSNTDKLTAVNEYNVFFSNVNYINNYINCISEDNYSCVYGLLDNKYIEDNNITYDNVFNYVQNYPSGSSVRINSMDFVQIDDNFLYYLKGSVYRNDYDSVEIIDDDFSMIIMSDFDDLSYSLYPVDDDYEKEINSIKKINIEVNDYNEVSKSELISKEQICVVYLSDFLNSLTINIERSYDLLSDDMKVIYSSFSDYKSYIINNVSLFSSVIDKCKMEEIDDNRVYTVVDSNENTYIFNEEAIMNYNIDFYIKKVD